MRVFTIINGYTGALCLQELIDQGHEVVAVVTMPFFQPDKPPEETVIGVATKYLLPLYMPSVEVVKEPAQEFADLMRGLKPDLLVSMHYPAIFKPVLLEIPPLGCINIHPSKLPEGRGMTPSYWYLYLGGDTAWTALHYLDAGVDSGDVIAFASVPISHEDTGDTVSKALSEAAWKAFRDNLPAIMSGDAPRQKQDLSKGSYLWSGRDWRLIRWKRKAKSVRGQIRCFTNSGKPAYSFINGVRVYINDAEVLDTEDYPMLKENAMHGEVLAITGVGPIIQTGEGRVILTDFLFDDERVDRLTAMSCVGVPVIFG